MISVREMKSRSERCVCKNCGSDLELRMVIFNRYGGEGVELYCPHCNRIEYGVEKEIYNLAKQFVDEYEFNYYPEMEDGIESYQMNVGKVGQLFSWLKKREQLQSES